MGLINDLSSMERRRVAVDPQELHFGKGCFACSAAEGEKPVTVRFTRTQILGILGGIESFGLEVPLCEGCASRYGRIMRLITLVQVVCVLIAAGAFGLLFWSFENPELKPYETHFAVLGIAAVVVAFISIGLRSRVLPIRFSPRQYGQIGRYGAYVFTFEDAEAAARFAAANK